VKAVRETKKSPGQRERDGRGDCCFNRSNDIDKSDPHIILLLDAPQ
jgi:hypothetical protein